VITIGRLLTEERGRTIGRRVVSTEGGAVKVEVSFDSHGTFDALPFANIGTYWSLARPGGGIYSEWPGGMKTDHGAGPATWRGMGAGRLGTGDQRAYRGSLVIENATGELAGLSGLLAAFEFSIDGRGGIGHKSWEMI
jgi:hypothetical protein